MLFQKVSGKRTSTTMISPDAIKGVWVWGSPGNYGALGLGDTVARSSPVQLGALTNWSQVLVRKNVTIAIKTDGTLWTWGRNNFQSPLGLGDSVSRSSPTQVGTLATWSKVSIGYYNPVAIQTNGTMWSWGDNTYGELGLGDRGASGSTVRSSPVQIGTLATWSQIAGRGHGTAAIKTDGTLWSWGKDDFGTVGDGKNIHRSSPVQIGTLGTWSNIASYRHVTVIKTDGTLWEWGPNHGGQLGNGDVVHRSSPVQVGTLAVWSQVSGGISHTLAIKTDGTQWAWGNNQYGLLGLGYAYLSAGDYRSRSSPVQVGTLATWSQVGAGGALSVALRADNTLWEWGRNVFGELGQSDNLHRSSPTQIGTLRTWTSLGTGNGGNFVSAAIRAM